MPGLVPGIHVFASLKQERRGWPGRSPAMTVENALTRLADLCANRRFVETIQSDLPCPVPFPKIFPFPPDPNQTYIPRHPVPEEGRIAIVTDVGHGMRWTRQRRARAGSQGGFSWTCERSNGELTNGAEAYGKAVWS